MADNKPLSPANATLRSDQEAAAPSRPAAELKRKKRIKVAICISVFIVVQIMVVTFLALTVFRAKSPKLTLGKVNVQNITAVPSTPSFDVNFTTQFRVKNTNWGPYKFEASKVTFSYKGNTLGEISIPKGKVEMRSTKKFDVIMSLNSDKLKKISGLENDLNTGVLTIDSEARMTGKVELLFVMKKRKSPNMGCTLEFNLSLKEAQFVNCFSY